MLRGGLRELEYPQHVAMPPKPFATSRPRLCPQRADFRGTGVYRHRRNAVAGACLRVFFARIHAKICAGGDFGVLRYAGSLERPACPARLADMRVIREQGDRDGGLRAGGVVGIGVREARLYRSRCSAKLKQSLPPMTM